MTRINSAIPSVNLTDEHLLAEHREITRMMSYYKKARYSGAFNRIPPKFCLGKGHVTFFLDKFKFLQRHYEEIYRECEKRRMNVLRTDYMSWYYTPEREHFNDYTPTDEEHQLLVERISQRIMNGKKAYYHYNGFRITKEQALELLKIGKFTKIPEKVIECSEI